MRLKNINRYLIPSVFVLVGLAIASFFFAGEWKSALSVQKPLTQLMKYGNLRSDASTAKWRFVPGISQKLLQNATLPEVVFSATDFSPSAAGKVIASIPFEPKKDGFSFENYINTDDATYKDLGMEQLRRLFGDAVCIDPAAKKCKLTRAAVQWMQEFNTAMSEGGHCEGLSALSLIFFSKLEDPTPFGSKITNKLELEGNEPLQREIAVFFSTQGTEPTMSAVTENVTPVEIVNKLIQALKDFPKTNETFSLGIYQPNFKAGHAITPIAVKDMGNNKMVVVVYDNNFPDVKRELTVDMKNNKWIYKASTNPYDPESTYQGDKKTKTLDLTPTLVRLRRQSCPFCSGDEDESLPESQYNRIHLEGLHSMVLADDFGNQTGYVDGELINDIPGTKIQPWRSAWQKNALQPTYLTPLDLQLDLSINGNGSSTKNKSTLSLYGPGYGFVVDEIDLKNGKEEMYRVSRQGKALTHIVKNMQNPVDSLIWSTEDADYGLTLEGTDLPENSRYSFWLENEKKRVVMSVEESPDPLSFSVVLGRMEGENEQDYSLEDLSLEAGDIVYMKYIPWDTTDTKRTLEVDRGGDGKIDEKLSMEEVQAGENL